MKTSSSHTVSLHRHHPAAWIACFLMGLSAAVRICHYLPIPLLPGKWAIHVVLPVFANLCFLVGVILGEKPLFRVTGWKLLCSVSVVGGVAFFLLKAFSFAPLHQLLCTILYLAVLVLYLLTVFGFLHTEKLLYPLFGLPLLYHLFVEDTRLYVFADPPVPKWDWMPEISVLCIMAALLSQSFAMRVERK